MDAANCSGTDISYTVPEWAQVGGCIVKGNLAEAPILILDSLRIIPWVPVQALLSFASNTCIETATIGFASLQCTSANGEDLHGVVLQGKQALHDSSNM